MRVVYTRQRHFHWFWLSWVPGLHPISRLKLTQNQTELLKYWNLLTVQSSVWCRREPDFHTIVIGTGRMFGPGHIGVSWGPLIFSASRNAQDMSFNGHSYSQSQSLVRVKSNQSWGGHLATTGSRRRCLRWVWKKNNRQDRIVDSDSDDSGI